MDQYHVALGILLDIEKNKEWDETRILESRVFIYDNLANLSLSMGLLDQSEKLFKETLKGYLQVSQILHIFIWSVKCLQVFQILTQM